MDGPPTDDVRIHLVADAIGRRWRTILVITLLFTVAAGAYAFTAPASYTSSAKVLIRPVPGNALSSDVTGNNSQITVAMETEANLVSSPEVTEIANERLLEPVYPGAAAVVASVPENTQIVEIRFTAGLPQQAQRGAESFAGAYLDYRAQQADATIKYQLDSLQSQEQSAESNLKASARAASKASPPPDAAAQVQLYASRLVTLQASIGQLRTLNTRPGSIVNPAKLPTSPVGIDPLLLVGLAALLGLGTGAAFAIWRERSDDRVRSSETTLAGVPVLAVIPHRSPSSPHLICDPEADERLVEAYRRARTGILAVTRRPTTLIVSTAHEGTAVPEVATNLALSFTQSGRSVVLVDAAIGVDEIPASLDLDLGRGLSDILDGASLDEVGLTSVHGMRVLGIGSDPIATRERYVGSVMTQLVKRLSRDAEFVIIAARALPSADASALALVGDHLVLVAADHQTTHQQMTETVSQAERLGIAVLGVVLTSRRQRRRHRRSPAHARALAPEASTRPVNQELGAARSFGRQRSSKGVPARDRSGSARA